MDEGFVMRPAGEDDLPCAIRIYSDASRRIGRLGIDQWQNGYPNAQSFREDVRRAEVFVAEAEGQVCGVMTVSLRGEPTYGVIRGEWSGDGRYAVVHRIAVAEGALCRGVGRGMLRWAYEFSARQGAAFVRIDTHEGNMPMRRLLESEGFRLCGVIWLANGDERLAYDKRI